MLVGKYGRSAVQTALAGIEASAEAGELTIIANAGVHCLPAHLRRGLLVEATKGTLDFSTQEAATAAHSTMLASLVPVLQSKNWRTIYLAPFGPPTISAQIKLLVYRITRLETVDLLYSGGSYLEIVVNQRDLIVTT